MTTSDDGRVRFLRVIGHRGRRPAVIASVDGYLVRWYRRGWDCECDTPGDQCEHVDTIAGLLDDRVLGDTTRTGDSP